MFQSFKTFAMNIILCYMNHYLWNISYLFIDYFRPAALLYYMLVAETGIEVGTFNLAFLCDDNKVRCM